ncbi:MAG TPA: gamma-glutamylcyclotransferase family protein [bacterium]|nr:gamma-glutamylcyclotransferase family protein [bacterium]
MPLYFAYGSSLLRSQMERRLMGNKPVTRAYLKGYRLAFMGNSVERKGPVVNLILDPSRMVPGTLYELNDIMIQYLDRAEACEKGIYQKLEVEVEKDDGEKVKADCYQLDEPQPVFGKPNLGYQMQVKQGYKEWGLPEEILEEALKWSEENTVK